mgnify:CR=1 FL=1
MAFAGDENVLIDEAAHGFEAVVVAGFFAKEFVQAFAANIVDFFVKADGLAIDDLRQLTG